MRRKTINVTEYERNRPARISCPIPLVKAKSILAEMKEGDGATFVINQKYRLENLKGFIKAQSQEIIEETEMVNDVFSIKIRKKTIRHFENCMVCSKPLEYLNSSVRAICQYCGKEEIHTLSALISTMYAMTATVSRA